MIKSTRIVEILQRKENYGIEHVGSANNRGRNHAIVDIEKDEHRCNEISEERALSTFYLELFYHTLLSIITTKYILN